MTTHLATKQLEPSQIPSVLPVHDHSKSTQAAHTKDLGCQQPAIGLEAVTQMSNAFARVQADTHLSRNSSRERVVRKYGFVTGGRTASVPSLKMDNSPEFACVRFQ